MPALPRAIELLFAGLVADGADPEIVAKARKRFLDHRRRQDAREKRDNPSSGRSVAQLAELEARLARLTPTKEPLG